VAFPALALNPRRLRAASRLHTRLVRLLRIIFPAGVAALLSALLFWPESRHSQREPAVLTIASDTLPNLAAADSPHMVNPRLVSVGDDHKPLYIRAKSAIQPDGPQGRIVLVDPEAQLILENGNTATVVAGSAVFTPSQPQDIQLLDGVTFRDTGGNSLSSRNLTIDTGKQLAFSRDPVKARFPSGSIAADGITISDGGASIRFQGRTTSQVSKPAAASETREPSVDTLPSATVPPAPVATPQAARPQE
jgi:lipopolysaccharide export system protein LptC